MKTDENLPLKEMSKTLHQKPVLQIQIRDTGSRIRDGKKIRIRDSDPG
jgi:hypothetical protein